MGKVAQNSAKYVIEAHMDASGLVEKPDIVGAIFGQTEGLLGDELDLRELQERGKVGRIDVQVREEDGEACACIKIPSSLDATETSLLAASLETIERVGPSNASIEVEEIIDKRTSKRDYIVKRAKQLLEDMEREKPEKGKITDEVKQEVRTKEIEEYWGFKAGPDVERCEEIVLVEGKADLMNLLRHGVKNAMAIGGTSIPEKVQEISEEKTITAFLDGDRGGDLILKELKKKADPDYICRAPKKKEVEELGKENVYEALRDKTPVKYEEAEAEKERPEPEKLEEMHKQLNELVGTRAANLLNEEMEVERKFPADQTEELKKIDSCYSILIDAEITREIIEEVEESVEYVIGMDRAGNAASSDCEILTRKQLEQMVPEAEK